MEGHDLTPREIIATVINGQFEDRYGHVSADCADAVLAELRRAGYVLTRSSDAGHVDSGDAK